MNNIALEEKDKLLKIIHKYLPKCKVFLFGSRVKNTFKQGADIDLALDIGKKIDWKILGDIEEDLEESTIPVFVDLIDIYSVDKEFLDHIKTEWVEWKN